MASNEDDIASRKAFEEWFSSTRFERRTMWTAWQAGIAERDKALEDAEKEAAGMKKALLLFINQWNACGTNSEFGRYFQNVRDAALAAIRAGRKGEG